MGRQLVKLVLGMTAGVSVCFSFVMAASHLCFGLGLSDGFSKGVFWLVVTIISGIVWLLTTDERYWKV
jgi:hypothetical protein